MRSASLIQILTVLGFILVPASSTDLDSSPNIADSATAREATRFQYKRKSDTSRPSSPAVAPVLLCHGNLPPPQTVGNPQAFASLLDWCLRGPAQCTCVYRSSTQMYDVHCALDDHLLDMVPGIVTCHNQCHCGGPADRAELEDLAHVALILAGARAGVAGVGLARE